MSSHAIPLIRLRDFLVVSIQVELSDRLVNMLRDDVAYELSRRDVHGLIIEVSGVDIFDSYIAASVRGIAQVARLMGVDTVVAGLDAAMAITLVEMGMTMTGVRTALNLDAAMDSLETRQARRRRDEALLRAMLTEDHGV